MGGRRPAARKVEPIRATHDIIAAFGKSPSAKHCLKAAGTPSTAVPSASDFGGSQASSSGTIVIDALSQALGMEPGRDFDFVPGDRGPAEEEIPAGQVDLSEGRAPNPTISGLREHFDEAQETMKNFDDLLNNAERAFKSDGFDAFNTILINELKGMGFVPASDAPGADAPGAPAAPQEASEENERETLFRLASEAGTFDMRGKVGSVWSREVKHDPRLRAAYAAVGSAYQAQRMFRENWATQKWQTFKSMRCKSEKLSLKSGLHRPYFLCFVI